jgi:hypothetical protein
MLNPETQDLEQLLTPIKTLTYTLNVSVLSVIGCEDISTCQETAQEG